MNRIRCVMTVFAVVCSLACIAGCASMEQPPIAYGGYGGYEYNDGYGGPPPSIWTRLFGSGKQPPLTSQQAKQYAGMAINDNGGPYLQQLRQYAKNGDIEAQAWLGDYYVYEWRNTESASYLPSAFKWCNAAAQKGISMSEYDLALLYKFGWGTPANEALYEKYIHLSADGGDAAAKLAVAEGVTEINSGTVIQIAPARLAAPAGTEQASSIAAPNMPSPQKTVGAAAPIPAASAAATTPQTGASAEAFWHRAKMLMAGKPANYAAAYPLLRKAARGGYAVAEYTLGFFYLRGTGTAQDPDRAVKWFKLSAQKGYVPAEFAVGQLYCGGKLLPLNYTKAAYWYRRAAYAGLCPAQYLLAKAYKHGLGVKQNQTLAVHWLHKAAVQGMAQAQCALGIAYFSGQGAKQNYQKAFYWFHKAARAGDCKAEFNLGAAYFEGNGVVANDAKAIHWLKLAAHGGYKPAAEVLKQVQGAGTAGAGQ
ncbi:MAG: tetratricopeptide repeat protein [Phycisphaerae bacterium]